MTFDDFKKINFRVAKVLAADRVEGSDKLVRLELDAGDKDATGALQRRQIVAGIGKAYAPEVLVGKLIVIVANLDPRTFTLRRGSGQVSLESNGMLLAASEGETPVLLTLDHDVPPGSEIR